MWLGVYQIKASSDGSLHRETVAEMTHITITEAAKSGWASRPTICRKIKSGDLQTHDESGTKKLGHAGAQYIMGFNYYFGEGVAQDRVEAVRWLRRAAEIVALHRDMGVKAERVPLSGAAGGSFTVVPSRHRRDLASGPSTGSSRARRR